MMWVIYSFDVLRMDGAAVLKHYCDLFVVMAFSKMGCELSIHASLMTNMGYDLKY